MSKVILNYQSGGHGFIYVAHAATSTPILKDSDYDLSMSQGFVWFLDSVVFSGRGQLFSYEAQVCLSDNVNHRSDIERAILLPFTVPKDGQLCLGTYADTPVNFHIPPGQHKLLFELRYFTDEEIVNSERHDYLLDSQGGVRSDAIAENRPEMCFFTFIPATEVVKADIVYPTTQALERMVMMGAENGSFNPSQQLILHNEHSQTP